MAEACGLKSDESFDEDDIYLAMDQLNGHWVHFEKQLYQRAFPQAVRLVLYDLTSVYFEGEGPEHLAQYGHSRDHRSARCSPTKSSKPRFCRGFCSTQEEVRLMADPFSRLWQFRLAAEATANAERLVVGRGADLAKPQEGGGDATAHN